MLPPLTKRDTRPRGWRGVAGAEAARRSLYVRALAALPPDGTVLDVGAGAGGASLPPASHAATITGVDLNQAQLAVMVERGRRLGVPVTAVCGAWPDVVGEVAPADVVVCHHVLYAVADLAPFALTLTRRARRRVVIEVPDQHPQGVLNPLWARFHGLRRPDGPTGDDLVRALRALGVDPQVEVWVDEHGWGDNADFAELVERTRLRLHLPPERSAEVAKALQDLGVDPQAPSPRFPGTLGRRLLTLCGRGPRRPLDDRCGVGRPRRARSGLTGILNGVR